MITFLLTACAPPEGDLQPLGAPPAADNRPLGAPPVAGPQTLGAPTDNRPLGAVEVSARLHEAIGSIVVVDWEQSEPADAHVEFSVDPDIWLASPTRALEAGPASEQLLGVPYGTVVSYRIVSDDGSGPIATDSAVIGTADLDPDMPLPVVGASDPSAWGIADRFLVGSVSTGDTTRGAQRYWIFVLDRRARVVWARVTPDTRTTLFVRLSTDGTKLLWDESTFWSELDSGAASLVRRTRIDLSEMEIIGTPGLHYEYVDLPDGSIVWGDIQDLDEQLIERNGAEDPHVVWSCAGLREILGDPDYKCGSNSLWWDARTDHLLLSLFTTSTVFEIDRATGSTLRWFGKTPGAWAFEPVDSAFEWQHGVSYTDEGNLLLVTRDRSTTDPGPILPSKVASIAREYALVEEKETLVNVWSSSDPIVAHEGGDAHRLSTGNTLVSFGTGATVQEVTPDGTTVWSLAWTEDQRLGRTFFVADLYALLR